MNEAGIPLQEATPALAPARLPDTALPPDLRLTVAAVARRLGVAPATLRTWDRRYGLGPSEHTVGSHRRYTPTDVARLELMTRMLHLGSAPAESARVALNATIDPSPAEAMPERVAEDTPSVRGLTRAAVALDAESCRRIVEHSVERSGVVATWNQLIGPAMSVIGQRWESTGSGVEVEHLLSEVVIGALQSRARELPSERAVNQLPVLLACAPDDLHTLPLFATAAALAERDVSARVLGARVPAEALVAAAKRTGPGAVLVWSCMPCVEGGVLVEQLAALRPAPLVVLGGPGWDGDGEVRRERVDSLAEAVALVARAVCM